MPPRGHWGSERLTVTRKTNTDEQTTTNTPVGPRIHEACRVYKACSYSSSKYPGPLALNQSYRHRGGVQPHICSLRLTAEGGQRVSIRLPENANRRSFSDKSNGNSLTPNRLGERQPDAAGRSEDVSQCLGGEGLCKEILPNRDRDSTPSDDMVSWSLSLGKTNQTPGPEVEEEEVVEEVVEVVGVVRRSTRPRVEAPTSTRNMLESRVRCPQTRRGGTHAEQ
ncbi:hypothetical protein EYF80_029712 [Liparis tanakae]|uniref:Uncharacterized protein n=1 Tax=Liparis tanakae TaxID=230148 RepID=A0A4Z2H4M8_9TELE|nr:hypothetical protein EYF80_029712 [Liparis tanakae]